MTETATATRAAALDVMAAVLDEGRPLDDAFDPPTRALGPRDRAFARLLVATTLRRLGRLDRILKGFLDKPLPKRASGARHLLRLGAAQMLFLGTPAHAAVATAVEAARRRQLHPYAGLINAVLRKIAREGAQRLAEIDDPFADLPPWLAQSWVEAYGPETAAAMARASSCEAPLDLTPTDGDAQALAQLVGGVVLPTGSVRLKASGAIPDLPGFREGKWWVQDTAAAQPVRLAGPVAGRRVLDLCAAPGGKTLQLASAGARVVALDRSEPRLARVRENLDRTHLGEAVTLVCADATTWAPADEALFDVVLVDAPCSATGTVRRHPDAPWRKRPGDAAALAPTQDALLDTAIRLLAPGGVLIYGVCSLQPEEGAPRIEAALARHPTVRRNPVTAGEAGLDATMLTPEGDVRLLPCHLEAEGGMDGFFIARLVRP
ncbi:RsmB/NOP family class I SAM-dependent RNA methyltransferase [Pararhodospirillum oryzae]|uniref:SAM-dependent methyltransferase n=1 Tax=Pararhodospirillum oryzae TaxID=478448 RepID=A0A512H3U4_9PROT|nr:transcription antitermination factor NusB [Pararhodospirillum oryzae]GEO80068.1 SAM-dependent methyltransferase [Pararhodospirillum oryzae]